MFGYDFGRAHRRGMGMQFGPGMGMGPMGFAGPGPCCWNAMVGSQSEVEMLRRYKDRLELHKKELEAEIKAVEKRIAELET